MTLDADQLARDTSGHWHGGKPASWTGWGIDTRKLAAGEIFVALRTPARDGHDFLEAAAAAGAAAALVARLQPEVALPQLVVDDPAEALAAAGAAARARFAGPVVGVTGSSGKTTTKDLLARLLGGEGVHRTAGNLNNQLGVPLTLLGLRPKHTAAVVEAGMNEPGEMARLASWILPDVAVVTMVGPAHLEKLGTVADVAVEKAALVRSRRPGGWGIGPVALRQWPAFADLTDWVAVDAAPDGSPVAPQAAVVARWRSGGEAGGGWRLAWHDLDTGRSCEFGLPAVTPGQVANAALACTVAARLGRSDAELAAGLAGWVPDTLRGGWHVAGGRRWYVDCYNANPASLLDAAGHFGAQAPARQGPRQWVVGTLGELGASAPAWHERVGCELPVAAGDGVWLVGPAGLTAALRRGLESFGRPAVAITEVPEAAALAAVLAGTTGPIFLKGSRVHRLEQLLPPDAAPEPAHAFLSR